jgi:hypothetical protein
MNVGVSGLVPHIVRESRKKAFLPMSYVLDRVELSGVGSERRVLDLW